MPWTKTRNVYSVVGSDPMAEKAVQNAGFVGSIWGVGLPASSKEDGIAQRIMLDALRHAVRRLAGGGWVYRQPFYFSGGYAPNTFRMWGTEAVVDGLSAFVTGTGLASELENQIALAAPPGTGTRNDLVYLEVWLAEVAGSTVSTPNATNKPSPTSIWKYGNVLFGGTNLVDDITEVNIELNRRVQVQYRIRTVEGVNFTTYPHGVSDPLVVAQGPNASPTTLPFLIGSDRYASAYEDTWWRAGDGTPAHQVTLGTVDGFVYALPIAKVARTAGVTAIQDVHVTDLRRLWEAGRGAAKATQSIEGVIGRPGGTATQFTVQFDRAVLLPQYTVTPYPRYPMVLEPPVGSSVPYSITGDVSLGSTVPNGKDGSAIVGSAWCYLYLVSGPSIGVRVRFSGLSPRLGPVLSFPETHAALVCPLFLDSSLNIVAARVTGRALAWDSGKVLINASGSTTVQSQNFQTGFPTLATDVLARIRARIADNTTIGTNAFHLGRTNAPAAAGNVYTLPVEVPVTPTIAGPQESVVIPNTFDDPGFLLYWVWGGSAGSNLREATLTVMGFHF